MGPKGNGAEKESRRIPQYGKPDNNPRIRLELRYVTDKIEFMDVFSKVRDGALITYFLTSYRQAELPHFRNLQEKLSYTALVWGRNASGWGVQRQTAQREHQVTAKTTRLRREFSCMENWRRLTISTASIYYNTGLVSAGHRGYS